MIAHQRGYAICTAPRSGSNLLCQFLTSTGLIGKPLEYFNTSARRALNDPSYPDTPSDQILQILTTGATPNGVYGVKLFMYQHSVIMPVVDWSQALPNLSYVYLERRDRLGQALSWARAIQTSQYRSTQPVVGEPRYDAALIRELRDAIDSEHTQWSIFFASRNFEPLRIAYEDLVADPQSVVDRVAQLITVRPVPKIVNARIDLAVQRDRITEEWRERFLSDESATPSSA